MTRFLIVFLTLNMSIAINIEQGFLARLGVDTNILFATVIAFTVTGLVLHRHLALIILVILMATGANIPVEVASEIGYHPDFLVAGLVGIVLTPFISDQMEFF